jgi:hydrogenase maturation protein HypF
MAMELGCSGFVCNDSMGVFIEVQGTDELVAELVQRLSSQAPTSARVTNVVVTLCEPKAGEIGFEILASRPAAKLLAGVAPDICVCDKCLSELRDVTNRRYGYPFINCTNCGPRFTIVESLPYDRLRTTMRGFEMCEACYQEYLSPADRRFHAEPNACPACGPKIWFTDSPRPSIEPSDSDYKQTEALGTSELGVEAERARTGDVLEIVQTRIALGQIVAIKGVGGFHLACDATDRHAVQRLREKKQRPDKPFAVMVADLESCNRFARVSAEEAILLTSPQRPIVLLEKKRPEKWTDAVAPGSPFIGVMLAYSPLHYLLIPPGQIWVMTSGNLSEEPIAIDNGDAWSRLGNIAEGFLFHNRPICVECDDSVLRLTNSGILPIRRSRGFAPMSITLCTEPNRNARSLPTVLAVGGELKATVCLAIDSQAFLSQHIGDMGNAESQATMERLANHLMEIYQTKPDLIAADMHPGFLSVRFAEQLANELAIPLVKTQHHHAHAASLLAEHGMQADTPMIACVFDGTGFGTDGTIWGGEWLIASAKEFQRFGHLRPVPLPGGDACILRPARSALAHLYGASIDWSPDLTCVQSLNEMERGLLRKQIEKRIQCTDTTSMGRLFDAVSSLAGVRQEIHYEGQAAIELESLAASILSAENHQISAYAFHWEQKEPSELHLGDMLRQIVTDFRSGLAPGMIGAKFHQTLALATLELCLNAKSELGIDTVGLTGGVFQNVLLTQLIRNALDDHGFRVLTHSKVPPNDAGIALGQVAIVRARG